MRVQERLADRSRWTAAGRCPVEMTMKIVGSRNAMLIMREAFYGTTRFDAFADRVEMSPATTSSNLKALTEAGLLERRAYREPGSRARDEYLLTRAGTELMPVLLGLFAWGSKYADAMPSVELVHAGCEEPVEVRVTCAAGHRLADDDIELRSSHTTRQRSTSR